MPFDAAALLTADRLRQELIEELDFAKAAGEYVESAAVENSLNSAKADIAEAFTLVSLLDQGAIEAESQVSIWNRILKLSRRSTDALENARNAAFPKRKPTDLFAVIYVRADELENQLTLLNNSIEQLSAMMPALVRPIKVRLDEVANLLGQARAESRAGEAAQNANDLRGAVSRKQVAENALERARTILHEDLRKLEARPSSSVITPDNRPVPVGEVIDAGQPLWRRQQLQQIRAAGIGGFHGKGFDHGPYPESWVPTLMPYLESGEELRFVTCAMADVRSDDSYLIIGITERRLLVVGDRNGLSLTVTLSRIKSVRFNFIHSLKVTTTTGWVRVGTFDSMDVPPVEGLLLRGFESPA